MNEQEIDLMDELYFVQSYEEVQSSLDWKDDILQKNLLHLRNKGFIKFLSNHDEEYRGNTKDPLQIPWSELYFLATKKGLLEHNGF